MCYIQLVYYYAISDKYLNVKPDFHAKFPHIDAVDSETGLFIQISTGNDFAILTSRLLAFYTLLDERVLQVCGMICLLT